MMQATEDINDLREIKHLTDLDSWMLKYYTEKKSNFDKDEEIANLKLQLMEAQKTIITYKVLEDRNKRESVMNEHLEALKNISKANDIPEDVKWSYNQETGEIILDSK